MSKTLPLVPRMSEKAYAVSQTQGTYVFDVPQDANKHTVARAVSAQFDVTVTKVNITNIDGKAKRTIRKGGRVSQGKQADTKKAYVTLKKGESLPIFAAIEEAEEKDKKAAELAAKAAEKRAKKEDK